MPRHTHQRSQNRIFYILLALATFLPSESLSYRSIAQEQPVSPESIPAILDCEFTADFDGSVQRYVMIDYLASVVDRTASSTDQPRHCLIALHGHGSDRWQFIQQTRDEVRAVKDFVIRHRMLYISPDYRAPTSWMGPAAESDMLQIIKSLKEEHNLDKIYLCGGSMGGTSALTFAALHPELIAGVASMNGMVNHVEYEKFQDAISESFGGHKRDIFNEYKKRSPEYWPEKLSMPIGMTIDTGDEIVPPDSCIRLNNILRKLDRPVKLIERPDSGHDTNYDDATAILEFMLSSSDSQSLGK